jgi:hypothetical protein|tara:strand:+ start:4953 stop:5114 length:162 start_codon:yes stop_codon:yes gene_type:complete
MNDYRDEFVLHRYEVYLDEGYSPKDAGLMAQEDYEVETYEHQPEECDNAEEGI